MRSGDPRLRLSRVARLWCVAGGMAVVFAAAIVIKT